MSYRKKGLEAMMVVAVWCWAIVNPPLAEYHSVFVLGDDERQYEVIGWRRARSRAYGMGDGRARASGKPALNILTTTAMVQSPQ